MACWSAENATNAYLKTLKMGQKAIEPDEAEFISAMAAGNNAQLMVMACSTSANSNTLALLAAAHQTGGNVVCILPAMQHLKSSYKTLGPHSCRVKFVIGDAKKLLTTHYREADFLLIDCRIDNHEEILKVKQQSKRRGGAIVVGYNALCCKELRYSGCETQLLPIGGGLLVTRMAANVSCGYGMRNQWVVKVDEFTGEEHVFRVRFPQASKIQA